MEKYDQKPLRIKTPGEEFDTVQKKLRKWAKNPQKYTCTYTNNVRNLILRILVLRHITSKKNNVK